ncbi:hypothetical protein [Nocardiopsis alba]|uniref:hypothetical protein n=1 Tax=Nocardiopsis alba TaxID=53437 RepID=UPI0033B9531E
MELDLLLRDLIFLNPNDPLYLAQCLERGLEPTGDGYVIGLFHDTNSGTRYTGVSEDIDYLKMVEEYAEKDALEGAHIDPTKFTRLWEGWGKAQ